MKISKRTVAVGKKIEPAEGPEEFLSEQKIVYSFVPQAFTKAYLRAWSKLFDSNRNDDEKCQFLVIEEINRGNCAQIFGDLFQLLDRSGDGYSTYPIEADTDLARYIGETLSKLPQEAKADIPPEVLSGEKLVLPPNLYIWATMNTSDQSLFPMDSAFKRRWDWKYVPIAKPTQAGWKDWVIVANGKTYGWWEFLEKANNQIFGTTKSADKQLGYFFVKASDATGHIAAERFAGKVLFYLYNDIFKDHDLPSDIFGGDTTHPTKYEFKDFFDSLGETKEDVVAAFLEQMGISGEPLSGESTESTETVSVE